MGLIWLVVLGVAACHPEPNVLADGVLPARGGNPWGPEATRARALGELPAIPFNSRSEAWDRWGRDVLRDGDLVFRLGDTRILWGYFPLSWFIARATGSRFSHVGVVAVEQDGPVVYDCAATGIQRQPFAIWIGENLGAFGVKRLKLDQRAHIAGALDFCRRAFEAQVPFDFEFSLDDEKLYCIEMVEKAFRSHGLPLSEPVRIGDWENISQFPLSSLSIVIGSRFLLKAPISLEQPVYVPGNDHQGLWGSRRLDTVALVEPNPAQDTARPMPSGLGIRGDASILLSLWVELHPLRRKLHVLLS
jgi:hypothetical protein